MSYERGGRSRGGFRGSKGGGRGVGRGNHRLRGDSPSISQNDSTRQKRGKILLLHGNRQTGEILLGRLGRLQKALRNDLGLEIVAPDAPHLFADGDICEGEYDDQAVVAATKSTQWQRTWWHRKENAYDGLDESVSMLDKIWTDEDDFVAIIGFSQGSRLAHLMAMLHAITNGVAFPGLKCVVHFSGYGDCPLPDNLWTAVKYGWKGSISPHVVKKLSELPNQGYNFDGIQTSIPSLHVMGQTDKLIPMQSSEVLLRWYVQPSVYVHPGNHFVPVKRPDVERYIQFFEEAVSIATPVQSPSAKAKKSSESELIELMPATSPDEEHAQIQIDEVTALTQIFPDEFSLLSQSSPRDPDNYDPEDYSEENRIYDHPIKYSILLQPQDDDMDHNELQRLWPPKVLSLCIQYTDEYPDAPPLISLAHEMNYLEFSMQASDAVMCVIRKAMQDELGMPCVMGVIYAARDFFEGGQLASCTNNDPDTDIQTPANSDDNNGAIELENESLIPAATSTLLQKSTPARIKECTSQGLRVACALLGRSAGQDTDGVTSSVDESMVKGGTWRFTIGLVGKPSAGKSTFFNAATAFARQRGEGSAECAQCEGAAMAPHPFTTIDPNIGFCLVPAPQGTCPEDIDGGRDELIKRRMKLGSTHGRTSDGSRLIPVSLKDVAGLVPGAYQGRGRGNKFLDDLTDADCLVHIVDASGSSDAEGNKLYNGGETDELNNPLGDLEWVRTELVEWVYHNVLSKWDSVVRRGKERLVAIFSGYKQNQTFTYGVFSAVERYVKETEGRDCIFDTEQLPLWDEGDLHRLVSAFLGARFPMSLALNKNDLPSSGQFIKEIQEMLPIHGAHVGVGLSAHSEMKFVRHHIMLSTNSSSGDTSPSSQSEASVDTWPGGVWKCLQSALSLRQPILVFPVNDMNTYQPLPGMINYATRDSSLPNTGFVAFINASGGCAPSQWDMKRNLYDSNAKGCDDALRDCLVMKNGSTVEHVFLSLKNMGALEGDYVRAEKSHKVGEKSKPASKSELVSNGVILRIQTTKRAVWQKSKAEIG